MGDNNQLIALNHPVLQHLHQQQQQQQLNNTINQGKIGGTEKGVEGNESSASTESDYEEVSSTLVINGSVAKAEKCIFSSIQSITAKHKYLFTLRYKNYGTGRRKYFKPNC